MMEPGFSLLCLIVLTSTTVGGQAVNTAAPRAVPNNGDLYPFVLNYTPTTVYEGITDNIELRCRRDTAVDSSIVELMWMRMLMYTPDHGWRVLAELRDGRAQPYSYGEVSISGRMAPVEDSYLSVLWTKPSDTAIASYKCLTLGLNQDLSFVVDTTPTLTIKAKKISEAVLLDVILDIGERVGLRATNNSKTISNTTRTLEAYSESLEQHFNAANERLDNANLTVESMMSQFLFPEEEVIWPAGTYALLKPELGCPVDLAFYDGDNGYFKLHTESSTMHPQNKYSQNIHLSRPIETSYSINTFMTFRFCVANGVYNSVPWPKGKYCIHKKGTCPKEFHSGYITFKTETSGNLDAADGNRPDQSPSKMDFCCMANGNPITPINLPTAHPFYLYPYDGRCQEVKGMKATEEYVQVHTEPGSAGGSYHPYLTLMTPGYIVRLLLCYYTKY